MITEQGDQQSRAGAEVLISDRLGHAGALGQMGKRQCFRTHVANDSQCGLHELSPPLILGHSFRARQKLPPLFRETPRVAIDEPSLHIYYQS